MIPLGIVLFIINELFVNGFNFYKDIAVVPKFIQIVAIFAALGIMSGLSRWHIFDIYYKSDKNLSYKLFRFVNVIITGVLNFALPLAIAEIVVEEQSQERIIFTLVLWIIVGIFFGYIQTKQNSE